MPVSYWIDSTPETAFPPLEEGLSVDVAILGAGITGLTAATLLKEAGKTVAVLDAKRIVRGVTGYTTAKLTSGHGLVYDRLIKSFGLDGARTYAESNEAAIEHVARWVAERGIECDFERTSNYVYTESESEVEGIQAEVEAAAKVGLPVSFVTETELPYPVAGAIELANQAQFHPRKYLLPLAEVIPGEGSHVFEQTRALDVRQGDPCRVATDRGTLEARDVVLATHIPFLDRGLFFAKAHPYRGYALTVEIDEAAAPAGMYITSTQPSRTIRSIPRAGGGTLLLLGGEGHKPGEEADTEARYRTIETFAGERFGATTVTHRWSTQDYISVDHVPYIGKLGRRAEHLYVATGFNKWGLTSGTLAAMILSDLILGRPNPWANLYDANRLTARASARAFFSENARVAAHFVGDRLRRSKGRPAEELRPGEGAVLKIGGERLGVSRDDEGTLHAVSAVCTHLRCIVGWNAAERSWDCPCHGSRFSPTGTVIEGPAVDDLPARLLPEAPE